MSESLKELRGKLDIAEVAKELGVSVSSLEKYERGDRTPRDEVKVRIAKYYDKTVEELFFKDYLHI